jgi:hypothetical protein
VPPGQVRMRKAKGAVSFTAALVLLFQAGVTVAYGGVFVSVGVWLLRRPRETSADL